MQRCQHAGGVIAVGPLPIGHGPPRTPPEGTVDRGIVKPGPLQRDLQLFACLAVKLPFAGARFGQGFVTWWFWQDGDLRGFCLGGGGVLLLQRFAGGGQGGLRDLTVCLRIGGGCRVNRCDQRNVQDVRAHGPELLLEPFRKLDKAVARNHPVAAVAAQQQLCVITAIGADRDSIPAAAQGKAVHILKIGAIGTCAIGRRGQIGLGFDLYPNHIIGRLCKGKRGNKQGGDQGRKQSRHRYGCSQGFKLAVDKQEPVQNTMLETAQIITKLPIDPTATAP